MLLDKELLEDIKKVGRTIGHNFKKDVSIFSDLNNAPDVQSFRHVLKEMFFKMFKFAAGKRQGDKDDDKILRIPRESRVDNILNSINDENIEAVKDTLLIYACLSALRGGEKESTTNSDNIEVEE